MSQYVDNWLSQPPSRDKMEEMANREEQNRLKFVENLVLNTFHMDVQLKKLEEKISLSKDVEQIIPKLLLNQYIDSLRATNNKNKEILINISLNN